MNKVRRSALDERATTCIERRYTYIIGKKKYESHNISTIYLILRTKILKHHAKFLLQRARSEHWPMFPPT